MRQSREGDGKAREGTGTRHARGICASVHITYIYDRTRCVGTCQVQESAYSPRTRVPPCVECRVILFYVFYEKPIIITRLPSQNIEKGSSLRWLR